MNNKLHDISLLARNKYVWSKAACLIRRKPVAASDEYKLKRSFPNKHANFGYNLSKQELLKECNLSDEKISNNSRLFEKAFIFTKGKGQPFTLVISNIYYFLEDIPGESQYNCEFLNVSLA